ncbi:MAG: LptF/LptG family permease [Dysgonamonadaceae bacterium]|jgi:lipopolysaccharide export system permease protein|nr:LptF/LptG family permease [Dysgonamonadaceae bacterium]
MLRIKRLHSFLIQSFLPLLTVMFSVCLFVLLMQFLWKYVDEMVGKGVEFKVLIQLFFHAANMLVPMCLPLAILLASLMTFGNLGERFELLAIKAAGISLIRIMKPLLIVVVCIAAADFVFQDTVLPRAQTKVSTILLSLRQKSPELDIPERAFYKELPGYNIYMEKKERNGMFRDVMIYDYSHDSGNDAAVIVADSGCIKVSADKKYNILALHSGESFRNLRKRRAGKKNELIPYQREKFRYKEIVVEFDSNFNMVDESFMEGRDISKDMNALRHSIDSMSTVTDSINRQIATGLIDIAYGTTFHMTGKPMPEDSTIATVNDFFENSTIEKRLRIIESAKSSALRKTNDLSVRMFSQTDARKQLKGHQIEMHRRIAASAACILFFFIGAPLGAIIRKGGLGLPTVLSVFIFILYYTIDTFGFKMAKQNVWEVWQGMWLSSLMLTILGAFITHKAINDFMINTNDMKRVMSLMKTIAAAFGINVKTKEDEDI